jgi:spore maturation protein CgeB
MADHFRKVLTHTKCYWIPEGINIQEFHSKPCEKRNIDILQMGRKYDRYHDMILPFCIKSGIKYVYEKEKGKIIFKDKSAFIEGLASTKISICTPQSITNPEKVGIISTITQRYLQSMSSKCLILGIIPKDMEKVFNYRPLIPIDMEHPQEQIKKILKDYKKYTPLIEQNYVEVKKHHQWKNRIEKMQDIINTTINHHI